ncbi:putative quinol monooxygenase [Chryseobacterium sp. MYb264]|uniref:putative quinol monooxygenase n=1 Tax=Chryseobacterium sp. MYb264 TaxID=2745153 RepID=UPI002E10CCAF|nr:putative quinol monooxygenase [Chryseobacterium sp. MYb264]
MLHVIAKSIAKKDKIEETKNALEALIEPTRKENGCIQYDLLQDHSNPALFFFTEIWESNAHLDAHLATDHFINWKGKSDDLLDSPMEVSLLKKV